MSQIKDIALAPSGEMKIDWVERNMPVLRGIGEDFKKTQPFAGLKIAPVSYTHLTLPTTPYV